MSSNEEPKNDKPSNDQDSDWGSGHDFRGGGWRRRRFLKVPFILIAILIKGAVVMFLWNELIPDLFHGPSLVYWQALGLMVLAKLLVGFGGGFGLHRHCGPPHHSHRGFGGRHRGFGGRERWAKMSDEERRKMRDEIRHRCR